MKSYDVTIQWEMSQSTNEIWCLSDWSDLCMVARGDFILQHTHIHTHPNTHTKRTAFIGHRQSLKA